MYKKAWCTCKLVVLRNKPIAFLTSSLPSPSSLLKLPNVWEPLKLGLISGYVFMSSDLAPMCFHKTTSFIVFPDLFRFLFPELFNFFSLCSFVARFLYFFLSSKFSSVLFFAYNFANSLSFLMAFLQYDVLYGTSFSRTRYKLFQTIKEADRKHWIGLVQRTNQSINTIY